MKNIFNSLFFQMAVILILILGGLALFINHNSFELSEDYHNEITQALNKDVSRYIVDEVDGLYDGQQVNGEQMGVLMHHVMATNPNTEVYLLDLEGTILKHVAMNKVVKATSVDLGPVKQFIANEGKGYIKGDDPRELGNKKIFSAAPYYFNDKLVGYIYTIVGGQDYDAIANLHKDGYVEQLNKQSILYSTSFALIIGLIAIYFLTRNMNTICRSMHQFQNGDLSTRIQGVNSGEFGLVANTFNEMADSLQKSIEELKGVDELRKELIANISHDLRTPIASIQGYAETLLMKPNENEENRQKYLQIIMKGSQKLRKLVDDLFELSKLQSNQRMMHPESIQMAELIQDISDKYRIIAKEKGISINTIYSKNLPLVEADLALIDRVLQNLIDNAIKFCHTGDVITLELSPYEEGLRTTITDTGQGIEAEELPHIFERYQKGKILTDSQKGSGLGLAIVKKILELHKSSIHVNSVIKKGSQFYFDLPYKLAQTA